MFILTQPINLYSTKLTTDMIGRYAWTEDSVCPMYGFSKRLQELWHTDETNADIRALFEMQPDFDADTAFPAQTIEELEGREDIDIRILKDEERYIGRKYDPYKDKTDFSDYVRHLEKIPEGYMDMYLENLVPRLRYQSTGVVAYNRKHPIQNNFVGTGDNGLEITERIELISDYSIDREQLQNTERARQMLPYIVKRLSNMSRLCRIHILSFISSFVKAKNASDKARRDGISTSRFKLNDVIRVGVWKCDATGKVVSQLTVGDKNPTAPTVFAWACGGKTAYSSYYEDMVNYLTYCEALSIDILSTTMLEYDVEYMKNIFVPIVTSNTQYDKLVADALRYYGVQDTKDTNTLVTDDFSGILAEIIANYQSYYYSKPEEYEKYINSDMTRRNYTFGLATDLMIYQNCMYKQPYRPKSAFTWSDGLLHLDGELCQFVTSIIDRDFAGKDSFCVLSNTGYLLRVEPGPYIHRVMMKNALDVIILLRKDNIRRTPEWEVIG